MRQENRAKQREFGHKQNGTVETHQKAARVQQGSLMRMYEAGQLTIEQLASSQSIRSVAERIGADVGIGTVSLETRVDQGRPHDGGFFERLGAVRAEVAYGRWRASIARKRGGAAPVLAMIVDDMSCSEAARLFRMRKETARTRLRDALNLWPDYIGKACDEIDEATMLAAQAGIL
ncbi:hypothetical protein V5F89_12370 [Pelagerythrobacter marensis]|uniref:Uncharacterized protein n=1 Tax=Pelagerythrobacter marensis TaxID=543877 RepID=A0ABZ2D4F5_9SPHN